MRDGWKICIRFSTLSEMQARLPDAIKVISSHGELSADRTHDLRLVLSELSINALQHGQPPVSIIAGRCCCGDIHILVSHKDIESTFDPCNYFRLPPDPESERGRGIFLAYSLADSLAYNTAATKALLKIRCTKPAV